ncbi:DUF4153 domain-containing protein [Oceanobacillus kapialis]|uniref:DUF4153 domain-containing protein n=1 Tax=Oceanobacillus kapialis TaxID=481353 RepID=A0ABW5Q4J1_9BACI
MKVTKKDYLFLLVCIGLGLLAEVSFFHGRIGVSYLVFVAGFYAILFYRTGFAFYHRRIGLLLMLTIWILAGSYLYFDSVLFYYLNLLVIPILMYLHVILITTPEKYNWASSYFTVILKSKLQQLFHYISDFFRSLFKRLFKDLEADTAKVLKHIFLGVAFSLPLLFVVGGLLMSADSVFEEMLSSLPSFLLELNFLEGFFRTAVVIVLAFVFFGLFQIIRLKRFPKRPPLDPFKKDTEWEGITSVTILIILNLLYGLFAGIQFTYFFGGSLEEGLTYAEYARRGFFELSIVTLINWTLLISFLSFVKASYKLKRVLKVLYTLLIVFSAVLLVSAYQRLSMYEAAYGYTIDRVLAHGFMIFLMVIFAYTLIKVWLERVSLLHFYLIAALLFYTGLNAVNVEQVVTKQNVTRYETKEKIDIDYLYSLSYTGWGGLLELYQSEPDYPGLQPMLHRIGERLQEKEAGPWQSYNFKRQEIKKKFEELGFY